MTINLKNSNRLLYSGIFLLLLVAAFRLLQHRLKTYFFRPEAIKAKNLALS